MARPGPPRRPRPAPPPIPAPARNAHAASRHLNVSQPLGNTVALVCHAPADRYERLLLDKDSLNRLDHHGRTPLLARGPEGHAETVTVLLPEHAL
ncbi:hypothetical protein [Streptomyces sp. NPDC000961]|uniref:hypothetical protein n=1 Tax=Streptomyces sp. NPDC000961 TaxID=3364541 RepID=UPI00369C023A